MERLKAGQRRMVAKRPTGVRPKRPRQLDGRLTPSWQVLCSKRVMEYVMWDVLDALKGPVTICSMVCVATAIAVFAAMYARESGFM